MSYTVIYILLHVVLYYYQSFIIIIIIIIIISQLHGISSWSYSDISLNLSEPLDPEMTAWWSADRMEDLTKSKLIDTN